MTEHILKKVDELFVTTPEDIGVGFGYKRVGDQFTDEKVIVFNVVKKLPLSELEQEDVLPTSVEIDGVIYNTDVVETGGIRLLACNNSSTNPCFSYGYPPDGDLTPNSQQQRPLKGGSTITDSAGGSGTLGFIAKDSRTGKLVGVTNQHVMYGTAYSTLTLQYSPYSVENPLGNIYSIAQGGGDSNPQQFPLKNRGKIIGLSLFARRINRLPFINYSDSAVLSLMQKDLNNIDLVTTESWKQVGLDIGTSAPPFATTAELNNLLANPNMEVASSGGRTGPKQGACGLRISQINVNSSIGDFSVIRNCIEFTRIDPTCLYPAGEGDSGSALFGKIGGVWKIIGLVFAGSYNYKTGLACRIDKVAEDLGIEAWNGTITPTSFINPSTIKVINTQGLSGDYSKTIDGKFYQQGGVTSYPVGNYPYYKYIIEIYTNRCTQPATHTFAAFSQIPAEVGKWYSFQDTFAFPCKVVSVTNDFGYFDATNMFKQTPSSTCS